MAKILDRFEAGFNGLILFLAALVALSIGLFAFLIPVNLLMIKMEWGSIWWLYESVEYALYVGVFLGAPWVLQQGAHVRVDVLTSALPQVLADRLEQVLDLAGALLSLLLCYYGIRATLSEYADGTVPDKILMIPNWYMMAVFAVAFALLAVEFGLRIRRAREAAAETGGKAGF